MTGAVTQAGGGRGFADEAVVDVDAFLCELGEDGFAAVRAVAFFVAGEEQGEGAGVRRGGEALQGDGHRGDARFHVGGATSVEFAVAEGGFEGRTRPGGKVAGRDDVGVSGKGDKRRTAAVCCPEVVGVVEAEVADDESCRLQAGSNERLTASVVRGDGGAADEFLQEVEGGVHEGPFCYGRGERAIMRKALFYRFPRRRGGVELRAFFFMELSRWMLFLRCKR